MKRRIVINTFTAIMLIMLLCSACSGKNKTKTSDSREVSETEFDTSPADYDSDGISDYNEVTIVGTSPFKADTDEDGIDDYHEDSDSDGILDGEEVLLGTFPRDEDTDSDGISDKDEIDIYHTNPCEADTDSDGAEDLYEIEHGTNPLVADESLVIEKSAGSIYQGNPVTASIKLKMTNGFADSLKISRITPSANRYIVPSVAGYTGPGYRFSADGVVESAEITFVYDTSEWTISDKFKPRIYYFDEEEHEFEEIPNQVVEEGKVTVVVKRLGIYVLLNKVEYDKLWENSVYY